MNEQEVNLTLTPNQYSCLLQAIELLDKKTTDNTLKSKDVDVLVKQIESHYEKFNK